MAAKTFKRNDRVIWTTLDGGRLKGRFVRMGKTNDMFKRDPMAWVVLDAHPHTEAFVRIAMLEPDVSLSVLRAADGTKWLVDEAKERACTYPTGATWFMRVEVEAVHGVLTAPDHPWGGTRPHQTERGNEMSSEDWCPVCGSTNGHLPKCPAKHH